ncbi:MAG: M14 family zinc carboxypeptidase [Sandaracinaceae bacterium]
MHDHAADRYLDWPEVLAHLDALATSASAGRAESIGDSREGGLGSSPSARFGRRRGRTPRFWLDGGTHAAEWTGVMAALDAATKWVAALRDGDPKAEAWFRAHTVYVAPCISPDGFVAMRAGGPFLRSTTRPPRDGRPRIGLDAHDVDGDGQVRWMRWRHPAGPWVFDDADNPEPRRRTVDDDPADAWFLVDEGTFLEWDGVRWLEAPRRCGQDLNRNFPASWAPFEMFGMDGGDYPLSEPESRAVVDAFRARPRIAAALSNHTYTGAILTHPYRDPSPVPERDLFMLRALARSSVEGTGYACYEVVPDFTYDPKKSIIGVWADTLASVFGVVGYTLELWDPLGFAGLSVEKPARMFVDPDVDLLGKMLDAFAKEPGALVPWRPFDHPQLGPVEIGGLLEYDDGAQPACPVARRGVRQGLHDRRPHPPRAPHGRGPTLGRGARRWPLTRRARAREPGVPPDEQPRARRDDRHRAARARDARGRRDRRGRGAPVARLARRVGRDAGERRPSTRSTPASSSTAGTARAPSGSRVDGPVTDAAAAAGPRRRPRSS